MKPVIALGFVAILITGCMPTMTNIYRPEAPGGVLRETMCGYNNGPGIWDALEFKSEGATIKFQAKQVTKNEFFILITIKLPNNTTASIIRPTILVASKELDAPFEVKSDNYSWYDGNKEIKSPINAPLIGHTFVEGWGAWDREYYIDFSSTTVAPENFEITPPTITINEKIVKLPKINFHWEKTSFIKTINC